MTLASDQKQNEFFKKVKDINRHQEEEAASQQAVALQMPYIDLYTFPVDLNALAMMSEEQAKEAEAVIFYKEGDDLRIGTVNPDNTMLAAEIEKLAQEKFKPKKYYISRASFDQVMSLYSKVVRKIEQVSDIVQVKKEKDYQKALKDLEKPGGIFTATQILADLLGSAYQYKASDIHIEPQEKFIRVRLRLDGVLTDVLHLPKTHQQALVSRVKILSKLKFNVTNAPQDGRFTYSLDGNLADVRV